MGRFAASLPFSSFWEAEVDCYLTDTSPRGIETKEHLLPTSFLWVEKDPFADVYMGWNKNALLFCFSVRSPIQDVSFDTPSAGDAIELFLDTRKGAVPRTWHRFAHHFVLFPIPNGSMGYGKEVTKFRGSDMHPLCDPKDLHIEVDSRKTGYTLYLELPQDALCGYAPEEFSVLGCTYSIHRKGGSSQTFFQAPQAISCADAPATWSRIRLEAKPK